MPSGLSRGWTRIDKATFLTPDEKRAAVGYGPLETGSDPAGLTPSDDPASKFNPHHDALCRFTFAPDGGGVDDSERPQPAQGRRFFGRFPAAKPLKDAGAGFGGTPKGLQFTKHGRDQAAQRDFTEQRIDAIVENNAKTRVGKVDLAGQKTWEYTDPRGNTVVLNEHGGIVTVYSPDPGRKYIPKP